MDELKDENLLQFIIRSQLKWIAMALEGKELSSTALLFPLVRDVQNLKHMGERYGI